MITDKPSENAFLSANKVRRSWAGIAKTLPLGEKLCSYPKSDRWAMYEEIDREVRHEYIKKLKEHTESCFDAGNTHKDVSGRVIVNKGHEIDMEQALKDSVVNVLSDYDNLDFYTEPKAPQV